MPHYNDCLHRTCSDCYLATFSTEQLLMAQPDDPVTKQLKLALCKSSECPTFSKWKKPLLHRYRQLWSQLKLVDGIVYCGHSPEPLSDLIDVPIVPSSLQKDFLLQHLKSAAAGHQGSVKTLQQLHLAGYWVNMAGT